MRISCFTEEILPGEAGQIEVSVDPNGMMGYMSKQIIVFLKKENPKESQQFILNVFGELSRRGDIVFKPQRVSFPDLVKGEKKTKTVTIQRLGYSPLGLESVFSDSPYLRVKVLNSSVEDPYKAKVELQIDASGPLGSFGNKVVFKTNQPNCQNTATLEISGNIISHVSYRPSELYLGLIDPNKQFEKTVNLYSHKNQSFKVVSVTTDNRHVTASIAPLSPLGSSTEWEIILTGKTQEPGILEGVLKIEIENADLSIIDIPFTGFVKE